MIDQNGYGETHVSLKLSIHWDNLIFLLNIVSFLLYGTAIFFFFYSYME